MNNFSSSFESLKELCDVLENFFQFTLSITGEDELDDICSAVKVSYLKLNQIELFLTCIKARTAVLFQ